MFKLLFLTIVSLHKSPQSQSGYFSVVQNAFLTTSENPSIVNVLSKSKYTFLTGSFASDIQTSEGTPPLATHDTKAKMTIWAKRQTVFMISFKIIISSDYNVQHKLF